MITLIEIVGATITLLLLVFFTMVACGAKVLGGITLYPSPEVTNWVGGIGIALCLAIEVGTLFLPVTIVFQVVLLAHTLASFRTLKQSEKGLHTLFKKGKHTVGAGLQFTPFGICGIEIFDREGQMRFASSPSGEAQNKNELFCPVESVQVNAAQSPTGHILDQPMQVTPVIIVNFETTDTVKLSEAVDNLDEVVTFLCEPVQTAFRQEIGKLSVREILDKLLDISLAMEKALKDEFEAYGLTIQTVRIADLVLPSSIKAEQAKVVVAAAAVEAKEAEKKAAAAAADVKRTEAEGDRDAMKIRAEGSKAAKELEAQGDASAITTRAAALKGMDGDTMTATVDLILGAKVVRGFENAQVVGGSVADIFLQKAASNPNPPSNSGGSGGRNNP